jgi:hypothetical protein
VQSVLGVEEMLQRVERLRSGSECESSGAASMARLRAPHRCVPTLATLVLTVQDLDKHVKFNSVY